MSFEWTCINIAQLEVRIFQHVMQFVQDYFLRVIVILV